MGKICRCDEITAEKWYYDCFSFVKTFFYDLYLSPTAFTLKGGRVILTTVIENASLLNQLLDATPTNFLPSIPHLVYQYNLFTNYPSEIFAQKNPEIPD